ncbi:MAG: response regulator [Gallintestinimicrobium sp.]
MDGLELARKLNQDYPNIYIMLCTGFDEFEYAKEAVHLEIKEYMLKPISATELSDSLVKLKNTLDKEREEKLNVKKNWRIIFRKCCQSYSPISSLFP